MIHIPEKLVIALILLLLGNACYAKSVFMCKSSDGGTFFQDRACDSGQVTLSKKKVSNKYDESKLTSDEKLYFNAYIFYKQSEATMLACQKRHSSAASLIFRDFNRYSEIAHTNIEKAENLVRSGAENVTSKTLSKYLDNQVVNVKAKLQRKSLEDLNVECRAVAKHLSENNK